MVGAVPTFFNNGGSLLLYYNGSFHSPTLYAVYCLPIFCSLSLNNNLSPFSDLYLMHWPESLRPGCSNREMRAETWRALEELYKEGTDHGKSYQKTVGKYAKSDYNKYRFNIIMTEWGIS